MPRTLLLEIGCEELPTSFIDAALEQLARLAPDELDRQRIGHGTVRVMGTARRLAVLIEGVVEEIPARVEELIGPPEGASRGADGAWTKAAEGFARKNGVAVDALSIVETPKGRYLRAAKSHAGAATRDALPALLLKLVTGIVFPKSMRWADIEQPFGRPVQWLVALFGADVVPFEFARRTAGRTTHGHRFLSKGPIDLATADAYVDALRSDHVLVDPAERRAVQQRVLEAAAHDEGGVLVRNAFLEREVLGLVEEPFAITGHFDAGFLALPEELIETVMSHHQRYFAVRDAASKLRPAFITTVNTALDPATIRKGNEIVLRARLADARFFVDHDRATKLASRVARLDGVAYHQKLGTYGDKVRRLEALAPSVAEAIGADVAETTRAATLCKADLVSLAVGEFPELQGIMGRDYARHDAEPAAVADAIAEHYLPRSADDAVAKSRVGAALAVADRLDTLVAFFAIGQRPSGGGDPFGLRRATLGLVRTLFQHRARLSLATGAGRAFELLADQARAATPPRTLPRSADETGKDLVDFVRERLENMLVATHPVDVVRACLAAGHDDPVDALERIEALEALRTTPDFARVVKAFERVFNISREAPAGEPDAAALTLPEERTLLAAFEGARPGINARIDARDFGGALRIVAEALPDPVDRFFDKVFVMDQDVRLRDARLRLLGRIAETVGVIARFDTLAASSREAAAATPG